MRRIVSALAILLVTSIGAIADPIGRYEVEGVDAANGNPYTASVTVERTGQTYRVTWVVGRTQYDGTGIGDRNFLAVSYRSGNVTGLALYGADGDGWKGIWAYAGGRTVGTEIWTRR